MCWTKIRGIPYPCNTALVLRWLERSSCCSTDLIVCVRPVSVPCGEVYMALALQDLLMWHLGIYANSNFTWSNHCKIVTSKAFNLLNVLRRTMVAQPRLKMWRIRVLSSLAWSMPVLCEIPTLRKTISIQNWTARWILKSRWDPKLLRKWTKSSRDYVLMLNWPSLLIRWIYMFLFDIYHSQLIRIYNQSSPFATISRHKKSQVYVLSNIFHH